MFVKYVHVYVFVWVGVALTIFGYFVTSNMTFNGRVVIPLFLICPMLCAHSLLVSLSKHSPVAF